METKMLQTADKILFIKQLYDYSSRTTKAAVRKKYVSESGLTERSFNNKLYTQRHFNGQEIDIVENAFLSELGQTVIDNQFTIFLENMSNADRRTKNGDAAFQNVDPAAQAGIDQLNDEMENGKLLISKQVV